MHRRVVTKGTYLRPIVRSKVADNGDVYEETEFVEPSSIPHPLEGVIYDPATMSLTAQLSAGVPLKPVSIGKMFSDPLEGERIALGIYKLGVDAMQSSESEESAPVETSPVETSPVESPKSE